MTSSSSPGLPRALGNVLAKSSPAAAQPLTLSEREELVELRSEVARVMAYLADLEPVLIAIAKHVDDAPPPRFEVPKGWVMAKEAAHGTLAPCQR
jgi:hypothetical protein